MNFKKNFEKLPKEKIYENPKIKESFSKAEEDIINHLNEKLKSKKIHLDDLLEHNKECFKIE